MRGRVCLCTLIDRKRKRFTTRLMYSNFLRAPTDLVTNAWHLRVQHRFSSVTSSAFLIQQDGEVVDEFRQHDDAVVELVDFLQGFAKLYGGGGGVGGGRGCARGRGATALPPPLCKPHHGNQRRSSEIKNPMTYRWPLPTLEHVQANGEPRRTGGGEACTSSLSDTATTIV